MRTKSFISFTLLTFLLLFTTLEYGFSQKKRKKKDENKEVTKYERANAEYLLIDAQKYFLLEDYKKSQAFLEQSLEIDPKNHAAYFKLAEIHFTTSETEKGLDAISMALSIMKENKYYYLLSAQLSKQKNDFTSAALAYEQMIQNTTDYHDYLLDLSDVYVSLGQYEKAIKTIETLETRFGNSSRFTLQKVNLLLSSGESNRAIDLVKELIESGTDDEEFLLEYANLVSSHRSVQEAIDFLEARDRTGKLDAFLIQLYLGVNQNEKAQSLMANAFANNRVDVEEKLTMIHDLLAQNNLLATTDLLISLQNALEEQYPKNAKVFEMSGRVYLELAEIDIRQQKNYQAKAIESYLKVKDLDPSDFEVWNRILAAEYETGDWSRLLIHSNEALDLYPNQGLFYFYNGAANLGVKEFSDASASLKQGSRLASRNPLLASRIYSKIAEVHMAQKETDQALQQFEHALSLENTHPEVLNTYSFQLALHQIDLAKALDISKRLIDLQPTSVEYLFGRSFVLFSAEQFTEAKVLLEDLLEENEQGVNGKTIELYGDVLYKLDLTEEAFEQWQKAKSIGGTSDKIDQKIATKQYNE